MSVEIEAKLKVDGHEAVRQRLQHLGATRVGRVLETNTFLDTDEHALRLGDQGLRVRRMVDDGGAEEVVITHKGPRLPGVYKSREETELCAESYDHAVRLLHRLGFGQTLSFDKRRESWMLGDCRVELDEVPHLGCFVEIEAPTEEDIKVARSRLQLDASALVKESYIALLTQHAMQSGDTTTHIRF